MRRKEGGNVGCTKELDDDFYMRMRRAVVRRLLPQCKQPLRVAPFPAVSVLVGARIRINLVVHLSWVRVVRPSLFTTHGRVRKRGEPKVMKQNNSQSHHKERD